MRRRRGKRRGGEGERERGEGRRRRRYSRRRRKRKRKIKKEAKERQEKEEVIFLNEVDMYKQWGEIKSSDMFTFLNLVIFSVIPGLWPLVVFLYSYNQFPFFD